jgi:SAM-dependent methyltransferase
MTEQSADQIAGWNDQSGEPWVANQTRLDAMLAVFGQAAIEAAAPATGESVLDVGCGAGASSLALAACVGTGGQVLGVDISEPLIGRARACTTGYAGPIPVGRRQQRRAARGGVRHPVLAFRGDVFRRSDRGVRPYATRAPAGWASRFRLLARRCRERLGASADECAEGHCSAERTARSRSARPIFVWRPGAGVAHPDDSRLH